MSTTTKTLAFFGATGGCAAAALASSLQVGHICTALARNPAKLRNLLLNAPYSLPAATVDTQLTIISGDVKSVSDVQSALISPTDPSKLVDMIISGIGGAPKLQASLFNPITLTDPHICESGMSAILSAISSHIDSSISASSSGVKPVVVAISSTGVSMVRRDVPWLMIPLYRWILSLMHADKRKMENLLFGAKRSDAIGDFVVVRPSHLTDGAARGLDEVRAGWEWGLRDIQGRGSEAGPAIGYSIGRMDVGEWIYREAVMKEGWEGKCISLTY